MKLRKKLPIRCRMRSVMARKGLTEEQVSARTGIRQNSINPIKNGKQVPRVDTALEIARVLGVTVEDIWDLPKTAA